MQQTPQSRKRPWCGTAAQEAPVMGSVSTYSKLPVPTLTKTDCRPSPPTRQAVLHRSPAAAMAHKQWERRRAPKHFRGYAATGTWSCSRTRGGGWAARARVVRAPQRVDHRRTRSNKQLTWLAGLARTARPARGLFAPLPFHAAARMLALCRSCISASLQFGLFRETSLKP